MQNGHKAKNAKFDTPIAMLNFNRPHLTRQVFEVVRQIRPHKLLVVADGPRADRPDDARLCAEVRAIFDEVDWECEVLRNFADTNMGSFKRNSTGLTWVFDTVEEAIILEDDCVPSLSFFPYCAELLERYRNDTRVGLICGSNFGISSFAGGKDSYFFSAYGFTWGWASWRRVWKQVDLTMSRWDPSIGLDMLRRVFSRPAESRYWFSLFESIHQGTRKNAWDYQLLLSCFSHSQYGVIPRTNLISNVGYSKDATHFSEGISELQMYPKGEMTFPLFHPAGVQRCGKEVDRAIYTLFGRPPLWRRTLNRLIRQFCRRKSILNGSSQHTGA